MSRVGAWHIGIERLDQAHAEPVAPPQPARPQLAPHRRPGGPPLPPIPPPKHTHPPPPPPPARAAGAPPLPPFGRELTSAAG
ncbi:hypothetical protein I5F74_17630 [Pseudomonas aeruginosa]|nr:hypothetical protein [Pseudomonas aeruginosa]